MKRQEESVSFFLAAADIRQDKGNVLRWGIPAENFG